jgi:transcriptional regulator with XRE-family HTH domain
MKEVGLSVRFGACVRQLRQERGYTQEEFADRCGFFRTYLSRIETGAANPTLNAIEVISIALDVRLVDVFQALEVPQ